MALDSTAWEAVGAGLTVNSGLMQTCSETGDKRRQRSVFGFHNTKSTVHEVLFPSCSLLLSEEHGTAFEIHRYYHHL